jgi:hypothetical protein
MHSHIHTHTYIHTYTDTHQPNIAVERLALLHLIRGSRFQISALRLGIRTEFFRGFPQLLQRNTEIAP